MQRQYRSIAVAHEGDALIQSLLTWGTGRCNRQLLCPVSVGLADFFATK
jgi:hypothetical protein